MKDDERGGEEAVKDRSKTLFAPDKWYNCEILNERLLSKAMVDHCIVLVAHMSKLFEQYD